MVIIVLCTLIIFGLLWLGIIIGLLLTIYFGITSTKFLKTHPLSKFIFNLIALILVTILLRMLVFEVYKIPSKSMEDALIVGDNIIVSKLSYGPRLPMHPSEISWLNIFFKKRSASNKWPFKRLHGLTTIKNGDVVIFNDRENSSILVKRCLGTPGDVFQIKNDLVIINGYNHDARTVKNSYRIWFKSDQNHGKEVEKLNIKRRVSKANDNKSYDLELTSTILNRLKQSSTIDSIRIIDHGNSQSLWDERLGWSSKSLGPYTIPAKGSTIPLTLANFIRYGKLINDFEEINIQYKDGKFYHLNKIITKYTFKHDYYMMLGDNRGHSFDSRYWGVIPEARIIGKAVAILYSKDDIVDWGRILKFL